MHPVAAATPTVMAQLIPAGLEVTTPLPEPLPETVRAFLMVVTAGSSPVGSGVSRQAWRRAIATDTATSRAGPGSKRDGRTDHLD